MKRTAKELRQLYAHGERDFQKADLSKTDLSKADLIGADLGGANLTGATLTMANLSGAILSKAHLYGTNLIGATLDSAYLIGADLIGADLTGATLRGTNLTGADLSEADLTGADLTGASLNDTSLMNMDIGPLCDAAMDLWGPLNIDWRSVAKSLRAPHLKTFLVKAGMPPVFAEYMVSCARSIREVDLFSMLQSTFISYGGPDEAFARKLYEALHENGVTTFFFAEHAVPGDKLHDVMRDGVNKHDRMILICSEAALNRKGVQNEIEKLLEREARDGGASYLIPIRLDDYLFTGWNPPKPGMAQEVRARVVADFRGTDTDADKFNTQLMRLLGALKKATPSTPIAS